MKIDKVTKMIEQPEVWLCHRDYANQGKICSLSPIDDLKIYVTANAVDEVSFTFHKNNNGVDFQYWDQIKDLKVICVDGFGYFEIAVDKNVSDDTKKVITGISMEAELGQITIDNFEVNGETDRNNDANWDSYGNYIYTSICDTSDTKHSLLHRLLSKAPHWKVGNVATIITDNDKKASTSTVYRTFNFSNTNIYDALQEIAKEVDVVFTFNTVTRAVNMYDLNDIGEDTTVYVSTQNLASDFTCSSNKDSIKNCFKVLGGDDLINNAVRAVNPNGSNYIYYMSPDQMEDMSDGLKAKLQKYDEIYEQYKDEYTEVCGLLYDAIDKVYELETGMFPERKEDPETDASTEIEKLTASEIGTIPVESLTTLYETGAKNAVLTVAQLKVDHRYEVSFESKSYDADTHTFTCKFKVENASDTTDSAISASDVVFTFVEDEKSSLQSKIDELLCDIDISDNDDIVTFKTNLKKYSKDYLATYESIYKECTKVLEKYSYKDKVEEEFYNLYHSYWEKWMAITSELDLRKTQIAEAEADKKYYERKKNEYQKLLDFETNMGDYYKEFCLYRREDTYQNDNYISDGMNNSELLQNAQKLVEVATKELYKASLFQTVYTANLNNLFTNPIYEPFYDKFDLFNWIHAEIDDKQVMLRLIGITYDFSSMEKIEVEFSDQVRNGNGISDIESILNQSKSMATSYSSTLKQAQNGQEACLEFDTIKQEGLNSALMNIKNSTNEEVVIDNCGINCRSKDQNDQYDQCQLRITGKNIVMTKDDFESACMAIGAGLYKGQEVYGVWCDLLVGDCIVSETMLIANSSGTFLIDKDGIIVKNMKLDMSNADGTRRIVIDPELDSILSIYTNSKQVFYVDTNGNMCMLGNLYVNNNNMYLKVDMTDENIIEVGYGEITGTGNEGEAGSGEGGVSTGNYVSMPVYRSIGGTEITDGSSKDYLLENAILEKNGETYFIDRYNKSIKKYNKTKNCWDYVSTATDGTTPYYFIKTNRIDNNLYICSYKTSSTYSILRFNLDDNTWNTICTITLTSSGFSRYVHDIFLDNNKLYVFRNGSPMDLMLYTFPNGIDDEQGNFEATTITINNICLNKIIPYNNSLYAIIITSSNYYGLLAKITDLSTLSYKIISNLDEVKTGYENYDQYCYTIMNDKLYVFCTYVTDSNKYFVCDLKTEEVSEYNGSAKLECSLSNMKTGNLVFNDGERIHLYNYVYTGRSVSYNIYYHTNDKYIAHYIYDDNNTTLVNKNFKELDYGKNFRISSQNDYITIGDVIYEVESYYTYIGTSTRRYDTNIRKLDTSDSENDWEIVYTFTNSYGNVITPIQSNSKDKIYFISIGNYLYYYDLNTKKMIAYFSGKSIEDEDFETGDSIGLSQSFGYLDETTMTYYINRQKLIKVDITTNTSTSSTVTHANALSNQIYLDGYFYFVGVDGYLKLYRTSIEDGSTETLCILEQNSITEDKGFSIFYYNGKIQVFYSYDGVLSKTRYVYNIVNDTLETFSDVFQDLGLHNVDTAGGYQTCFLPMLTTSTGVHIFVGYPSFTPYVTNGGYKHYVYTESLIPTDPDNPDEPPLPPVDNPDGKIFYITNKGDGYFYGNVYAKDGKFRGTVYAEDGYFKGDIYANSLTLGENAVVSGNISATTGSIGGWTIKDTSITSIDASTHIGIELCSTGDIYSYGANQWMWLNGGNLYFGEGQAVDFSKPYSIISSFGVYVASASSISTGGTSNYLLEVNTQTDTVWISSHTTKKSALYIYNDSNTDTSIVSGNASGATIQTDYAGFSNRPLDIVSAIGYDDGGSSQVHINVFGESKGSGDGSSYDTYGRMTLRAAIKTTDESNETVWLGNDSSLSDGYVPSSLGSTKFRWGQGFFHDLTTTNSVKESSDKKLKEHIEYLDSKESLEFINHLQPAEYTMIFSENKRVHRGFYAQEVSKTAHELNCRDLSLYSAYVEKDGVIAPYDETEDDENLRWSLSYNEFIAPMVSAIQELSKENKELKDRIEKLEGEITNGEQ